MSYRQCRYILRQLWQQPFGHVLVSSFVQLAFWHFSAETESSAVHEPYPGRDSLASERPRSLKGPGEVAGGRGRGSAPSTASASTTRQRGERGEPGAQQPAPHTRRRARPPPPEPWGRPPSLVPAHAAQLSQSPQCPPAPLSPRPLAFLLRPPPRPRLARQPAPVPVAPANGSAALLRKPEGAGPGGDGAPYGTETAGDVAFCLVAPPLSPALAGRLQRALGAA